MATTQIHVIENIRKANDEIAAEIRAELHERRIASVNLMGAPGCGKTMWLERTLETLRGKWSVAVLTGDMATTRDAERIATYTPHVAQINTGRGCHLEAHQVRRGLHQLPLDEIDLLIIENVGNLICPVAWDLGQGARVGMFSVTEGEDKPAKHPTIVLAADLLLLSKTDLEPLVPFDRERFYSDVREVRDDVEVLEVSGVRGYGLERWIEWLTTLGAQT